MRQFRRDGQERMQWELAEFAALAATSEQDTARWDRRLLAAQALLASEPARQSPLEWVSVSEKDFAAYVKDSAQ